MANYIIDNVYVEDGVNGLYLHDGVGTYENAELEAGDNSYRYAGANYMVADEYQNEYTDINNFVINLNDGNAYIYKNKAYNMADGNEVNKFYQVIYEDFAIEYCSTNACDYEELLNQLLSGTLEDENISHAFEEFYMNLQINGDWAVVTSEYLIEYNGEMLFGIYDIYKYLAKEFCTINNCDADVVYNDYANGIENDLTIGLGTYLNENIENIFAESTKFNYLLAYDASIAFETYGEAANYAANDGALLSLNNYVCFGSDVTPCPEENLYQIIGVFDEEHTGEYKVKLIKADYATSTQLGINGSYYGDSYSELYDTSGYYKGGLIQLSVPVYRWNVNEINTWSESQLNTVNLNTNYINSLGTEWSGLIAEYTWQVGGASVSNTYNASVKTAYNYEVGVNSVNTIHTSKIGLMYVSDYGYAASPINWSTNMGSLNNTTSRDNNWMHMGLHEWTFSRNSDGTYSA